MSPACHTREYRSEVLVLGSGAAGLSAALACAPRATTVLSVGISAEDGSSHWAQGGIAAALGEDDNPLLHATDTLQAGSYRNDQQAVQRLSEGAAEAIARLLAGGAEFDRQGNTLALGREAAHSRARIVHAHGDATGAELMRTLYRQAVAARHLQLLGSHRAFELAQDAAGRVVGAWVEGPEGVELWQAAAVILATGGYAGLYHYTTNPATSDGGGMAIARLAGAALKDLEFVQFHPTALDLHRSGASGRLPLVTEALRGAGAQLLDANGCRFMLNLHPAAELAPRDLVARAVWRAGHDTGRVFLDARTTVGRAFPQRFPTVFAACRAAGIDPRSEPIPVTPAAHYCMGGVQVDEHGASSVEGLYAVGEVAASGVHGANRLASNSLLEGLVFGYELGRYLTGIALPIPGQALPPRHRPQHLPDHIRAELGRLLWAEASLIRDGQSLERAAAGIESMLGTVEDTASGRGLLLLASAAVAAMQARRESLGAHFRTDVVAMA